MTWNPYYVGVYLVGFLGSDVISRRILSIFSVGSFYCRVFGLGRRVACQDIVVAHDGDCSIAVED